MPFTSYYNTKPEDVQALYAYFKYAVAPANVPNRASDIPFPLSMRWPLTYWRWLFASKPAAFHSARGRRCRPGAGRIFRGWTRALWGVPHTAQCVHAAEGRYPNRRSSVSHWRRHRELLRSEPPQRWCRLAPRLERGRAGAISANRRELTRYRVRIHVRCHHSQHPIHVGGGRAVHRAVSEVARFPRRAAANPLRMTRARTRRCREAMRAPKAPWFTLITAPRVTARMGAATSEYSQLWQEIRSSRLQVQSR